MQAINKLVSSMSEALEFNKATLSGCVDVIVVRQPDGSLKSTPFHVRFGKLKLLKSKNREVSILINSEQTNLSMKLGEAGEGFFEDEVAINNPLAYHGKANSDKVLQPSAKVNQEVSGTSTNKQLLKMLQLGSTTSSLNNGSTKAKTASEELENNVEELGSPLDGPSASELIFMEDNKPKAFSLTAHQSRTQTIEHNPHRAHSLANIPSQNFGTTNSKTLRPNTAQLESLNLKQGINSVTYVVKSKFQGTQQVTGNIYLWNHDANIIISDVDGTITKSDVIGHLMTMAGRDWSQPGIAPLYTNIRRNGYHLLYLTSRAIGQAKQTKDFINSVYQDGKMLPHGPLITSPDRMLPSVKREIVFKRPELFKMAVLKDIRNLFPADHNPFHAGFGNRETDAIAYKSVGITLDKVFIVNPKGDIHHHSEGHTKSYAIINTMIKDIFPGILKNSKTRLVEDLNSENLLNLKDEQMMQANLIKVIS